MLSYNYADETKGDVRRGTSWNGNCPGLLIFLVPTLNFFTCRLDVQYIRIKAQNRYDTPSLKHVDLSCTLAFVHVAIKCLTTKY